MRLPATLKEQRRGQAQAVGFSFRGYARQREYAQRAIDRTTLKIEAAWAFRRALSVFRTTHPLFNESQRSAVNSKHFFSIA